MPPPKLKAIYFNARSVLNKIDDLKHLLLCNFDIISISETWLNNAVQSSYFIDSSYYNVLRKDRSMQKSGGGVACIYKKYFTVLSVQKKFK